MRRLYVVTSIVHLPHLSIYSAEQRYRQTCDTIACIRKNDPAAKIAVVESSPRTPATPEVCFSDPSVHMYYVKDPYSVLSLGKSQGEATILREFLSSPLFHDLAQKVDVIVKMSGRYLMDESYVPDKIIHPSKITARRVYFPHCITPDHSASITILFAFPVSHLQVVLDRLSIVIDKCNHVGGDIEQWIFYGLDDSLMHWIDLIGVYGHEAPTGKLVAY